MLFFCSIFDPNRSRMSTPAEVYYVVLLFFLPLPVIPPPPPPFTTSLVYSSFCICSCRAISRGEVASPLSVMYRLMIALSRENLAGLYPSRTLLSLFKTSMSTPFIKAHCKCLRFAGFRRKALAVRIVKISWRSTIGIIVACAETLFVSGAWTSLCCQRSSQLLKRVSFRQM